MIVFVVMIGSGIVVGCYGCVVCLFDCWYC